MPEQYTSIRDKMVSQGKSLKDAKSSAARIYIAKGKGGSRSSRAKALHSDKYDVPTSAMRVMVHKRSEKNRKKAY